MSLFKRYRARSLGEVVTGARDGYGREWRQDEVRALARWNEQWRVVKETVPYFRALAIQSGLTDAVGSWEEFRERLPVMSKRTIREQGIRLCDERRRPDCWRSTGGSTAEPIQVPSWNSENRIHEGHIWLARSWYGIEPASRLFLLWGHSHLLGKGWNGAVSRQVRRLKDQLAGYCRWSAYDMSEEGLRAGARALIEHRPEYVIGYSAALDRFVRVNHAEKGPIQELGVKAVIGAAERFPFADSRQRIGDLFGAPVGMEYGSVETSLLAHTHPDGGYRVFHRSYMIELLLAESSRRRGRILVTSLYPRSMPLIRYEIGDEVELTDEAVNGPLAEFETVIGRLNDNVALRSGRQLHSEVIAHAVRDCPGVEGYQLVVVNGDPKELRLLRRNGRVTDPQVAEISRRLGVIDASLAHVAIVHVRSLDQTRAGKSPTILHRGSGYGEAAAGQWGGVPRA
ncbi:MAG: hypothetical protein M9913_05880 [Bryobacteraceae bacterium]|nr:hypothetical protein [Solibacteraceae bacterium]MCO5350420.1 hypothetical protein [Bryobacteraceae bacterium]